MSTALQTLNDMFFWDCVIWIHCLLLNTTRRGSYYRHSRCYVLKCPYLPLDPLNHCTHTHTLSHVLIDWTLHAPKLPISDFTFGGRDTLLLLYFIFTILFQCSIIESPLSRPLSFFLLPIISNVCKHKKILFQPLYFWVHHIAKSMWTNIHIVWVVFRYLSYAS